MLEKQEWPKENHISSIDVEKTEEVELQVLENGRKLRESFENHTFKNLEFKKLSELSSWGKFGNSDFAKKFADLEVVVIDDEEKWKETYGSNNSKSSHSPKTIILKGEIFDRTDISTENLGWLVHEMGHVDFYDKLGGGIDEYMKKYYATGKYADSEMEQEAFQKQFEFFKYSGKTKEECIAMMKKYLAESFEENQENEKQQEFEQIKRYLENVYSEKGEEEKLVSESFGENDARRWIKLVENEEENTFNQYLNDLGISEKYIQDKEIIDIGAGNLEFAGYCLLNNLSEKIYSLEPRLQEHEGILAAQKMHWGQENYQKLKDKTIIASMSEIPFGEESFDCAFVHCAMPGIDVSYEDAEKMKEIVKKSFAEIIRVLKPGGEARFYPLPNIDNPYEKNWRLAIDGEISRIRENKLQHILIEDVVDSETGDVLKEKRLIIKKTL